MRRAVGRWVWTLAFSVVYQLSGVSSIPAQYGGQYNQRQGNPQSGAYQPGRSPYGKSAPGASKTPSRTPASGATTRAASAGTAARAENPPPSRQPASAAAAGPTVQQALRLTPVQADIDYARPSEEEAGRCKISVRKIDGRVGWVIEDAQGQTLRKFVDGNGDNRVDQWSYYKEGLEVYRDIDSDGDGKADQYRWFNAAGARWASDKDQDGVIDTWIVLSPEEATAEVVAAVAAEDFARFRRVALGSVEVRGLGLGEAKSAALLERLDGLEAKFKELVAAGKIPAGAKWNQFSGGQPGVVPAGGEGSAKDLWVYENATAVVLNGNNHLQVLIGTMVKVGEAWRVCSAPRIVADGQAELASGMFFQVAPAARPPAAHAAANDPSHEVIAQLEQLDRAANQAATADQRAELIGKRADLLEKLAGEAKKAEDRAAWVRQLADMTAAAVQMGTYPDGVRRLQTLFERLRAPDDKDLAGYVRFRHLTAEYGAAMQAKGADFPKIQTDWLKKLEDYVADYPRSPDAAEAMLQLGIAKEFAGQEEEAKRWYGRIVDEYPSSAVAKKAAGAARRIDSVGKVLAFHGRTTTGEDVDLEQYRGRVVLIQFWATWCLPCKSDMAGLKELYGKHKRSDLAIIGVNVDNSAEAMAATLREADVPWPQVFEPGGLESRPAAELGIHSLPAMILVDRQGKVISRNVTLSDLDSELKRLIR